MSRLRIVLAALARFALGLLLVCVASGPCLAASGCVATVHPAATDAGLKALRQGGNAVDAAVAAALMLGVVDGHNSGIGGGCFFVIRLADGRLVAIDGREKAGAKATRDMYLRNGQPQPQLSQVGPLAVGVPGALAAHDEAIRNFGRLKLRDLLLPAAELAEQGMVVDRYCAARLKSASASLAKDPGCRAALLRPDGTAWPEGERLRQPDLARTYRAVAENGIDWFYRGPLAKSVGEWMAANGGILTADDFAAYRCQRREPVKGSYRGYAIASMCPPSSGGIHVIQILNILEHFDLKAMYARDRVQCYHVIAEAMKLAYADRAHWLGDPDFTPVPRGLIDKSYASELAKRIRLDAVTPVASHGRPPCWQEDVFGKHTTHVAAVDGEGNWVALTCTINGGFGARVIVPGTGVLLNNQMDDFSIAPGTPNSAGLVGAEANAVAPGKRPLSSMSPTIVFKDDRPIFTVGAAGGPRIITQVVMAIVNHLDFGMDLPAAVGAPRIHQQWKPNRLSVERTMDPAVIEGLKRLGHEIQSSSGGGVTQAIGLGPDGRTWVGVHDPRVPGKAASTGVPAAKVEQPPDLFARENLVAWCIVPFDAKRRGPEERAAMLQRLGIRQLAYDWRAEHVPTFDAEIEALRRHGIRLTAFWFPGQLHQDARTILDLLRRHNLRTQLWVTGHEKGGAAPDQQEEAVQQAADRIRPIAEAAAAIGCTVELYNHGGWYGEPENQIAIIQRLGLPNVGIVYNLHHGHAHLDRFPELLRRMLPYLHAVNLNGMVRDGDKQGKKILPLGQGDLDLGLLKTIRDSGYRGPIGILNHTPQDAEARLQDNLDGLDWLVPQLSGRQPGLKPVPRTWKP